MQTGTGPETGTAMGTGPEIGTATGTGPETGTGEMKQMRRQMGQMAEAGAAYVAERPCPCS